MLSFFARLVWHFLTLCKLNTSWCYLNVDVVLMLIQSKKAKNDIIMLQYAALHTYSFCAYLLWAIWSMTRCMCTLGWFVRVLRWRPPQRVLLYRRVLLDRMFTKHSSSLNSLVSALRRNAFFRNIHRVCFRFILLNVDKVHVCWKIRKSWKNPLWTL